MKKRFITLIVVVIVLLGTPLAALAQSYSFSLDKEAVIVFLNEDSSISLDYTFVFTNDSDAHAIDFVDVGMPSDSFGLGYVTADVNGTPVEVSTTDYQGNGNGFAVVLGSEAIQPGETGTVHVSAGKITSVLDRDSKDSKYASFVFSPTWFGSEFVHGNTDLTVTFHLPPGVQANEPRFHLADPSWLGANEPDTGLDDNGRVIYTWHSEAANGHTQYIFGASFPMSYVPAYATQLAQPTIPPAPMPEQPTTSPQVGNNDPARWLLAGIITILILAIAALLKGSASSDNRLDYSAPQVSIEGYGIKRGLTAVEVAILLEQPLEKVLTMILFGVVKKGAAKVVKRDPLQLEVAANLPEDLHTYEKDFLNAFLIQDAREREEKLKKMFIDLINSVNEKIRGFSRDETDIYYRETIQRAWQQVREAGTPEVKNREFDENFDWLMLHYRFRDDVQELFENPGVTVPQWWSSYDQGFKLPDPPSSTPDRNQHEERSSSRDAKMDWDHPVFKPPSDAAHTVQSDPFPTTPETKPEPLVLPGAEYAASVVNSVQDFSSRVISDMSKFTERVHEVSRLDPIFPHWETRKREEVSSSSKSDDGFFSSLFGSSGSTGGSSSSYHSSSSSSNHHSSCACACAGCACACAGGGR